jgi:hypothetical protein
VFWWGILFNILFLIAIPFIPERVPHYAIPLAYSRVGYFIAEKTQLTKGAIGASAQFRFQSNWRVFGLSLAFVVGTLVVWMAVLMALDHFGIIKLS